MAGATISPTTPAPADRQWGSAQTLATVSSTPNVTAEKSRFRIARERRKLTQQELADYCEIPLRSIKRYDAGGRVRDIEIAQRLAEVLDQPLHWLWPPDNHPYVQVARANHPDAMPTGFPATPDPREVFATLHLARPGVRRHARWLAPAIAVVAAAAITVAVILATTDYERPLPQTDTTPRSDITPVLGPAAPPVLTARTVAATNARSVTSHHPTQRSHRASKRRRASASHAPVVNSSAISTATQRSSTSSTSPSTAKTAPTPAAPVSQPVSTRASSQQASGSDSTPQGCSDVAAIC
jgi:transcriptional regulator with XRE-family HTH domain